MSIPIDQVEPFGVTAIFFPFTIFLFTHDLWFTLSVFFLNKFIQECVFLANGGEYMSFMGYNNPADRNTALVHTVFAFLGIILSWYYSHLFQSPRLLGKPWTIANFQLHKWYYVRNVSSLLVLSITSLILSYDYYPEADQCRVHFGLLANLVLGVAVIAGLYYSNRTTYNLQWIFSHPPCTKRFSLRTRLNATYGLWMLTHATISICQFCDWNTNINRVIFPVLFLFAASTFAWFIVDKVYRDSEGERFTMKNYFRCFLPQWGMLSKITSDSLSIPGPGSFSSIPSFRSENSLPEFLLLERSMPTFQNTLREPQLTKSNFESSNNEKVGGANM
eukprot:TRINITY_DN4110_c0_g1_i1.p1 TRINITY_DN4110_c0_g1~~TRINITY_DN4110_c0_g1_i1.p1  ORF type:complete len:333 (+),score=41.37 TRINITY_DN4110_c0_g1_i1:269-1267(+)